MGAKYPDPHRGDQRAQHGQPPILNVTVIDANPIVDAWRARSEGPGYCANNFVI
jgi:hypothetical protein